MKIAFLSRYQNTVQRGAESFVAELSSRLSKRHEVVILSGSDADSVKKILSGKYDIVISINGGLQGLKASLGRLFGSYKLIITGQAGIGRGEIWNLAVVCPDIYVVLTDHMNSWAKRFAWHSNLVKIPNGVDLDKFSTRGEGIKIDLPKPVILSVGALVWYKHHERVIRAMGEIEKGSLLIVGDGSQKNELEDLGKKILGERFKIINFNYEDMPKVYRSADLFTLPSWDREAFGIVYLEAMATNLSVVAPRDKPREEIIGEAGILVDVTDPVKYAEAIQQALGRKWEDRPRKQAEKFNWDKVSLIYEKVFQDLLK